MKLKNLLIQIPIAFTIITIYDMAIDIHYGETMISYEDLFSRLIFTTIGFLSLLIFNYFEKWPLRFVQLLHYFITAVLFALYVFLLSFYTEITNHYIVNLLINYNVIYLIVLITYELYYRRSIRRHNQMLSKINNQK